MQLHFLFHKFILLHILFCIFSLFLFLCFFFFVGGGGELSFCLSLVNSHVVVFLCFFFVVLACLLCLCLLCLEFVCVVCRISCVACCLLGSCYCYCYCFPFVSLLRLFYVICLSCFLLTLLSPFFANWGLLIPDPGVQGASDKRLPLGTFF